ncbi:MAG TPA: hypothetical protein VI299_15355, partial [Polyangiales bacterium]
MTVAFAFVLQGGRTIVFEHGLVLESVSVGEQTYVGGLLPVTLRFVAKGPLPADYAVFVHAESAPGTERGCSLSVDHAPRIPSTRWADGQQIEHLVHLQIPPRCPLGSLHVRAGLYEPRRGARLAVVAPLVDDDRVFIGAPELVAQASDAVRTDSAASLIRAERLLRLNPWLPWLPVALFAIAWTALFSWSDPRDGARAMPGWQRVGYAIPAAVFVLGVLMVLEFVKDDAYISFRYAHNLVRGEGLVFNTGDHLEGMTNFAWVLLLAPFEALGLDLFQVCEWLGGALGLACVVWVVRFDVLLGGARKDLSQYWGALWLASSSSFVLYAKSGLEQPCAAFLPLVGAFVLYRARERVLEGKRERREERAYFAAGLLLGAGCMTRPELHLIAILVALPL